MKLREDSISYRNANPKPATGAKISTIEEKWIPKTYWIRTDGGTFVQAWADGLRLRSVLNGALSPLIDEKKILQGTPEFSLDKAVDIAKAYLDRFQISLSANLELTTVAFNHGAYQACWEVRWTRVTGGYPWDDFNPVSRESLVVIFHEKEGLLCLADDIYTPLPKSLDVIMTREQAIGKAAKCAPLVERTPFYKSARIDGFVVSGMKSCALKIAIPNYLLDPQRANWLPQTPPNETRLCWVVQFTTVDSKADQRSMKGKLIPPDIIIYLDAATGECVGANFS